MKRRQPIQVTVETIIKAHDCTAVFRDAIHNHDEFMIKICSDGFMPLVIEVTTNGEISIAHYYTQNGDAMRDPEITLNPRTWKGTSFTQDSLGIYQEVGQGCYNPGLEDFLRSWSKNLRMQGFCNKDRNAEIVTA